MMLAAKHPNTLSGPYSPTAEHIEDACLLLAHGGYESTRITTTNTAKSSKWRPPADLPVLPVLSTWIMRHISALWRNTSFVENSTRQSISHPTTFFCGETAYLRHRKPSGGRQKSLSSVYCKVQYTWKPEESITRPVNCTICTRRMPYESLREKR